MSDVKIYITAYDDHLVVEIGTMEPIHHHLALPEKREEVISQLREAFSLIGTVVMRERS